MIRQILSNNNETATGIFSKKNLWSNQGLSIPETMDSGQLFIKLESAGVQEDCR
jgi:hypothetical protein